MKNRRTTGRGVARKLVKKPQRPTEKALLVDSIVGEPTSAGVCSSDEVDDSAMSPEKALSASDGSDGSTGAKQTSLNGLSNVRNACYLNAIQLVYAALVDRALDELLANIDNIVDLKDFEGHGLTQVGPDTGLDDSISRRSARSKKLSPTARKKDSIRKAVKEAAQNGDRANLSVATRLRQLLEQMRTKPTCANEQHVSLALPPDLCLWWDRRK